MQELQLRTGHRVIAVDPPLHVRKAGVVSFDIADHDVRTDARSRAYAHAVVDQHRWNEDRVFADHDLLAHPDLTLPFMTRQRAGDLAPQRAHVCFEESGDGPDVVPEPEADAAGMDRHQILGRRHLKNVVREVRRVLESRMLEKGALANEDRGVCHAIIRNIVHLWFLDETFDAG